MLANITALLRPDMMRVKEFAMITWLLLRSEKSVDKSDAWKTCDIYLLNEGKKEKQFKLR